MPRAVRRTLLLSRGLTQQAQPPRNGNAHSQLGPLGFRGHDDNNEYDGYEYSPRRPLINHMHSGLGATASRRQETIQRHGDYYFSGQDYYNGTEENDYDSDESAGSDEDDYDTEK